jgi:hypothetical protein
MQGSQGHIGAHKGTHVHTSTHKGTQGTPPRPRPPPLVGATTRSSIGAADRASRPRPFPTEMVLVADRLASSGAKARTDTHGTCVSNVAGPVALTSPQ